MELVVKNIRCPKSHACPAVRICPVKALHQNNYDAPVVDKDTCIQCGKCVMICPKQALILE